MGECIEYPVERDFRLQRFGTLVPAVLGAGLTWLSSALALRVFEPGHWEHLIFVPVAIGAAWTTLGWLRRAFKHGTVLSITAEGILDGTALGSPVFIPWSSVASVAEGPNGTINLAFHDPASVRIPMHKRLLSRMLKSDRAHHYAIPVRALDVPHWEVAEVAREWHEALLLAEVSQREAPTGVRSSAGHLTSVCCWRGLLSGPGSLGLHLATRGRHHGCAAETQSRYGEKRFRFPTLP